MTRNQVFQYIWSNKRDICEEDWETIIKRFPFLETLQTCVHDFREMFVNKQQADLDEFLACYSNCGYELLQRFCTGLQKDYASVSLAVTSPYSNGFVEGTNNKLKMIKRTAYGRCSLNLLKSKMLLSSALI